MKSNQINNHLHYKQDLEEIQEINNKDYKFWILIDNKMI